MRVNTGKTKVYNVTNNNKKEEEKKREREETQDVHLT